MSRACRLCLPYVPRVCPVYIPCVSRMCPVCGPYGSRVSCVCSVRLVRVSYVSRLSCIILCVPCVCALRVMRVWPGFFLICSLYALCLSRASRLSSPADSDACSVHTYAGFFQVAENDELRDHCTNLLVQGITEVNALPIMVSHAKVLRRIDQLYPPGTAMWLYFFC